MDKKTSLNYLVKAETGILVLNLLCGLIFGWSLFGPLILLFLAGLAIYRLLVITALQDETQLGAWWYCVSSSLFILRVGLFAYALGGRLSGDFLSIGAVAFLAAVITVRALGIFRSFSIVLPSQQRISAAIAFGLGATASTLGVGWVALFFAAAESIFYGFPVKWH